MINLFNININTTSVKPKQMQSRFSSSPAFRASLPADSFEVNTQHLNKKEKEVLAHLNENRAPNDQMSLSKETLQEIVNVFVDKKKELPFSYKLQGKKAFTLAIRQFLCRDFTAKNSFQLSILQDFIKKSTNDIAKNTGFSKIYGEGTEDQNETNFKKFLGIISEKEGQAALERLLEPAIEKECYTNSPDKLFILASELFRRHRDEGKTCSIQTKRRYDGKYMTKVYLDDELKAREVSNTKLTAEFKALKSVLSEVFMFPVKDKKDYAQIPHIYSNNESAKNEAESMLRDMRFLRPDETLDITKDDKLITELIVTRTASQKARASRICQRFEFLGDAVANNFVSRFVSEKKLNQELLEEIYGETVSNDTFRRFAIAMQLPKHADVGDTNFALILAPDMFEAVVAVLYRNFPEERVYTYLKQLFEFKYKEIMGNRNNVEQPQS